MAAPSVFISYRRGPTSPYAGRLYDRLAERFGPERVFMDVDTIKPGADFLEHIRSAVSSCAAILVVIGPEWLDVRAPDGNRRLENPEDLVRLEVTTGLERGITVVPVLVQGARMPAPTELPAPLSHLSRRNAIEVSDVRWADDMRLLVGTLEQVLDPGARPAPARPQRDARGTRPQRPGRRVRPLQLAAAGLLAVAALILVVALTRGGGDGGSTPTATAGASAASRGAGGAGRVLASVPVGQSPTGVAASGPDLWVTNSDDATVTRIDASARRAAGRPIRGVGAAPGWVAVDRGGVWLTSGGSVSGNGHGELVRIDPATNQVSARYPVGRIPAGVATGAGAVWIANAEGTVSRVDPATGRVRTIHVGGSPLGIAVDGDTVWVTDSSTRGESISAIDATTGKVDDPVFVGRTPTALAVGGGWIWVANSADDTVVRVDAKTHRRAPGVIKVGREPGDLAYGAGGVWVVNESGGSVTRIDPRRMRAVGEVHVGRGPAAVATAGDAVWVTNTDDGTVSVIDATP
jgi:DNA-binding beta-propeller fold protein YncE